MSLRLLSPGGTPGGLVSFLIGLGMAVAGAYLLTSKITVSSGYWNIYGHSSFGLSLIPLLFGIGMVFFNGSSRLGLFLIFTGFIIILSGILLNLTIYFQSTSLYDTLIMLTLLAGGIGLVLRSLKTLS